MARVVAVADAFDAMTSDRRHTTQGHADADVAFAEIEKMALANSSTRSSPAAFLSLRDNLQCREIQSQTGARRQHTPLRKGCVR